MMSILELVIVLLTVAGSVATATAYIGRKFDKLGDTLTDVRLDAKDHVTFKHCSEHRHGCPIREEVREIHRLLDGGRYDD